MSQFKYSNCYLYLAVFITGAAVLMLEILGSRIVAPYYGNTIYMWSSLISVAILSLALGYALGGKLVDRFPRPEMLYLNVWLTGMSLLVIPKIDVYVFLLTDGHSDMFLSYSDIWH